MSDKEIDFRFTAFPNHIIDEKLPDIDGSSFKILMLIVRKTIGFQKTVDKIALSQFEKHTGLSKNTVIKSLKLLVDKQIIKKYNKGRISSYQVIALKDECKDQHSNKSTNVGDDFETQGEQMSAPKSKTDGSIVEHSGSNIEQAKVHKLNPSLVQNLNTQKKPIKENEINSSTTIKEGNVEKVIQAWNSKFDNPINLSDNGMINSIRFALKELSCQEIIRAMENRLAAEYYKQKKPQLLHRPSCFFPYLDTIKSDLKRVPDNLYTFDEYADLIYEKGYHGDDFELRADIPDKNGNPMRELIRTVTG